VELIVFDLDGTLLNRSSEISAFTSDTLRLLSERNIAYTVATGRTLHGARAILEGHRFLLPQAFKNGVMIWHPDRRQLSGTTTLRTHELDTVVDSCVRNGVTPFVFTLDEEQESTVYHPPLRSDVEERLVQSFATEDSVRTRDLSELPDDAAITHINSIGDSKAIAGVLSSVQDEPHLVAYSGIALEGEDWRWITATPARAARSGH